MGKHRAVAVSVLLLVACLSIANGDKKADDCVETRAKTDKTRDIALVNTARFHQEVIMGFISVLHNSEFKGRFTIYARLEPPADEWEYPDFGWQPLVSHFGVPINDLPAIESDIPQFKSVIFISPEYKKRPGYVEEFIKKTKPKVVIMVVHEGDSEELEKFPQMHPRVHLMALSPHVAYYAQQRINKKVGWFLPILDWKPQQPCRQNELVTCLSGFALQGTFISKRRNYTRVHQQMEEFIDSFDPDRKNRRLMLNLIGHGKLVEAGLPDQLLDKIQLHENLRFTEFYNLIAKNIALLPAFATDRYYTNTLSSSVITSIITKTPLVVTQRFLTAYAFMNSSMVVLMKKGEIYTDVMRRLLEVGNKELLDVRNHIQQLMWNVNGWTVEQLKEILGPHINE